MLNDGSYFSEEETGLLPLLVLVFVAIVAMMFVQAHYLSNDWFEHKRLDNPLLLTSLTLWQLLCKCLMKIVHLVILYVTGETFAIIEAATIFLSLMSQVCMIFIFILLAKGWTTFMPANEGDLFKLGVKNIIPLVIIGVLHWAIFFIMFFDKEEYHKFHEYSGFYGTAVVFLRVFFVGIFWYVLY